MMKADTTRTTRTTNPAAAGMATIIIAIFRHKQTVNLENINLLKG